MGFLMLRRICWVCWGKSLPQSASWAKRHLLRLWGPARARHKAWLIPSQGEGVSCPHTTFGGGSGVWASFWGGKCQSGMEKMEMIVSGNAAVMFCRKPMCTFSPGQSPAWAPLANSPPSPNPGLQQMHPLPLQGKKKRLCWRQFPSRSTADCDPRHQAKALPPPTPSLMGRSDLSSPAVSARRSLGPSRTARGWGVKADGCSPLSSRPRSCSDCSQSSRRCRLLAERALLSFFH